MSQVQKYALLPGRTVVQMPAGAELLTVEMQNSVPTLFALVRPAEPLVYYFLDTYGNGPLPAEPGEYVASVQDELGLVWHTFDATSVG